MHLRNYEGAARTAEFTRTAASRTAATDVPNARVTTTATPSRGSFFDMMNAATAATAPAVTPRSGETTANSPSADENSTATRGASRATSPSTTAVRNTPADPPPTTPPATAPPAAETPVETINRLLAKLGYDPSIFQARVTSARINYPGLSYDYPLLEVTVNGQPLGFHLNSAMIDPRNTAANISSMMGRPVMNFAEFV